VDWKKGYKQHKEVGCIKILVYMDNIEDAWQTNYGLCPHP